MLMQEFRELVARTRFTEQETIRHGFETIVYRKRGIPFVLKTAQDNGHDFSKTQARYSLAATGMGGHIAEFSVVDDVLVHDPDQDKTETTIAQEQGEPIEDLLLEPGRHTDKEQAVTGIVVAEHECMGRGFLVYDNFFKNSILLEGLVKIADLGHVIDSIDENLPQVYDPFYKPSELLTTEHVLNKRGFVIYTRAHALRALQQEGLRRAYLDALGLQLDDTVKIQLTLKDAQDYLPLITRYITRTKSLQKYAAQIEYFRSQPDKIQAMMALIQGVPGQFDGIPNLDKDIINLVARNKYNGKFQEIAQQEYDTFFRKEQHVPAMPLITDV